MLPDAAGQGLLPHCVVQARLSWGLTVGRWRVGFELCLSGGVADLAGQSHWIVQDNGGCKLEGHGASCDQGEQTLV